MTLVEFLELMPGTAWRDRTAAVLYWRSHYKGESSQTSAQVKADLIAARIRNAKNSNIPDVLNKAGSLVDVVGKTPAGHKLWALTESGQKFVRDSLGLPADLPEIEHSVEDLRRTASTIADDQVRQYVEEAVLCLSVGALRAAIVFMWVGSVRVIQERVWSLGAAPVAAAVQKYLAKKQIKKFDDLATVQESTLLDVARDLGLVDKAQWTVLKQCLDTRNQSGHPNKYTPSVNKAKAHIDDLVGILF